MRRIQTEAMLAKAWAARKEVAWGKMLALVLELESGQDWAKELEIVMVKELVLVLELE